MSEIKNSSIQYTEDEVADKLLGNIIGIINYWERLPNLSIRERLEGVIFSTLSMLDGCACDIPKFIVAPNPHPDDKEYYINNGDNYYPENNIESIKGNISGGLHQLFSMKLNRIKKSEEKI